MKNLMRKSARQRLPLALVAALALLSLGLHGCPPGTPEIAEGSDCWETQPGTFQRLPTLPANFFGTGSQAIPTAHAVVDFEGVPLDPAFVAAPYPEGCGCPEEVDVELTWVDRHGSPVAGDSAHRVKQVASTSTQIDTCIRRTKSAKFENTGAAVKVDIELVALSLKSVDPLEVTYKERGPGQATTTKLFDVYVTHSATEPQKPGTMTFTAGNIQNGKADGNVNLDNLNVTYDLEFREQGGTSTFQRTGLTTKLRSPGGGQFKQP